MSDISNETPGALMYRRAFNDFIRVWVRRIMPDGSCRAEREVK